VRCDGGGVPHPSPRSLRAAAEPRMTLNPRGDANMSRHLDDLAS
jgi:hypothetical protein